MLDPIPWRLACRILADCLGGQARGLTLRADPNRSGDRRGVEAGDNAAAKSAGRLRKAAQLRGQADTLVNWASDPGSSRRPGVDPGFLACLIAASYGHAAAWEPLAKALGPLDGPARADVPDVLRRISEIDRGRPPISIRRH